MIPIVDFQPRHAAAWANLYLAFLAGEGFDVEEKDRLVLRDPEGLIIARGGRIFVAEREGELAGCCALLAMADGGFELAKMAVAPDVRGGGVGRRLIEACEAAALQAGAPRLYLETTRRLGPALALYRRAGFVELPPSPSPYARADVWMEKRLPAGVRARGGGARSDASD